MQQVRDWFRAHGFTAIAGHLDKLLKAGLTGRQQADLYVAEVVNAARAWVKGGKRAGKVASGTALADVRKLADDLPAQEKWLNTEARARGYRDIDDLAGKDYLLFEKLAQLWRKKHPADVMLSRGKSLLAPNGKPSNLNERQWHQVRTPEFKAWFGDWEIAAQPQRDASTFSAAREAAKAFQGKPLVSRDGVTAIVSRGNLDKMLSASAVHKSESAAEHALAVANLDTLFAMAETGWTKTDREGDPDINAIRRLFAPMRVGNRARLVKLTVKEFTRHGNRLYSVEAVSVEDGSPVPEMVDADRTNGSRLLTGPTGLVDSLVARIQDYNKRGASKVVDENGEPMVVYRGEVKMTNPDTGKGTDFDRTVFMPLAHKGAVFASSSGGVASRYAEPEGVVFPFFMRLTNPAMADFKGQRWNVYPKGAIEATARSLHGSKFDGLILKDVKEMGEDGEVATTYAALNPEQIKSAIGNVGTFDPANPDIRLSRAIQPGVAERADAILADSTAKWRPVEAVVKAGVVADWVNGKDKSRTLVYVDELQAPEAITGKLNPENTNPAFKGRDFVPAQGGINAVEPSAVPATSPNSDTPSISQYGAPDNNQRGVPQLRTQGR